MGWRSKLGGLKQKTTGYGETETGDSSVSLVSLKDVENHHSTMHTPSGHADQLGIRRILCSLQGQKMIL